MEPVSRKFVVKIEKYLQQLQKSNCRPATEIRFAEIASLMQNIGFEGPVNQPGSARGFSHELLKTNKFLFDGRITIHIVHGQKVQHIRYRDFRTYLLPHIEFVLAELETRHLINEESDVSF